MIFGPLSDWSVGPNGPRGQAVPLAPAQNPDYRSVTACTVNHDSLRMNSNNIFVPELAAQQRAQGLCASLLYSWRGYLMTHSDMRKESSQSMSTTNLAFVSAHRSPAST